MKAMEALNPTQEPAKQQGGQLDQSVNFSWERVECHNMSYMFDFVDFMRFYESMVTFWQTKFP